MEIGLKWTVKNVDIFWEVTAQFWSICDADTTLKAFMISQTKEGYAWEKLRKKATTVCTSPPPPPHLADGEIALWREIDEL